MKLSTPRFTFSIFFQLVFLLSDLIFNCVSLFPRSRDSLLVLFIFQDLCLVISITTMLMNCFSTYLFQAGLVEVLARKFRAVGIVCASYLVASVTLHVVWLLDKWGQPNAEPTPLLIFLFTLHRCMSPWYYFFYKRAALRVSDPRFYEDMDWINRQLQSH